MNPEDALQQHLNEAAGMSLLSPERIIRTCSTCKREGVMKFNLVRAVWECPESFPCETIGLELEAVEIENEQVAGPVMEMY